MLALFMTIQHCTGGGGIAIRQEKEVENAKIGKKEAKLYLQELAENPRELTNNAQTKIKFSKLADTGLIQNI